MHTKIFSNVSRHKRLYPEEEALSERLPAGFVCRVFDEIPSTMDEARELLVDDADICCALVLAKRQSAGRGRQGREWQSPEGGFYCTFVLRSLRDLSAFSGFSLALGVAICDGLGLSSDLIGLKWPNDILSRDGRKLAGILVESQSGSRGTTVLAGIGINLVESPNGHDSVSLSELSGRVFSTFDVAAVLAAKLLSAFRDFEHSGFAFFKEKWLLRSLYQGWNFDIEIGTQLVSGVFRCVNDHGAIIIDTANGLRTVSSGHIVRIYAAGS